jgi:hypothetical protein
MAVERAGIGAKLESDGKDKKVGKGMSFSSGKASDNNGLGKVC